MGKTRTDERRKARNERRNARRREVAEERARLTAERLAHEEALRVEYRKAHPNDRTFTIMFRRNVIGSFDFSNPPVPYDDDPDHPEKGIVERTREMKAAIAKAAMESSN